MRFQFVTTNRVQRAPRTPRVPKTSIPTIQAASSSNPISARLAEDIIIDDNCWVGAFLNTCAKSCNTGDNSSKDMILGFDEEGKTFFQTLQESCPEDATKYINQCVDLIQKSTSLQEAFGLVVMTKMKSFSKKERQGKGKVYTPQEIVDWIHNKLIEQEPLCPADGNWTPGRRGLDKTYCDFACGTGHFVLDWYDRLMKHWEENQSYYQDLAQTKDEAHKWIVENCLYFADIDPFAIRICKMGLFLKDYLVAGLKFNGFCGDSLLDEPFGDKRFNYVAGNPPYTEIRNLKELTPKLKILFPGLTNAYSHLSDLFWVLSARRGEVASLITQDSIAFGKGAENIRKLLGEHIVSYNYTPEIKNTFKKGFVGIDAIILVWNINSSNEEDIWVEIQQESTGPSAPSKDQKDLLDKLASMRRLCQMGKTINGVDRKGKSEPQEVGSIKWILGERQQITPYRVKEPKVFLKDNIGLFQNRLNTWDEQEEKILCYSKQNIDKIAFGYYKGKNILGNNHVVFYIQVSNLIPILGILNSRVVRFWMTHKFPRHKHNINLLQPKLGHFDDIPIPLFEEEQGEVLSGLVRKMLQNPKDEEIQREIDELIFKLYGLTEEEIQTIKQ